MRPPSKKKSAKFHFDGVRSMIDWNLWTEIVTLGWWNLVY